MISEWLMLVADLVELLGPRGIIVVTAWRRCDYVMSA